MHTNETIVKQFAKDILNAFDAKELVVDLQNKNKKIHSLNVDVLFDLKDIEIYSIHTQKIRAEKNYFVLNFDLYIMDKKIGLVKKDELLYKIEASKFNQSYLTEEFISHLFIHYIKYDVYKLKDKSVLTELEKYFKEHFVYEVTSYGIKETLPTTKESLYQQSHIYIGKYGKLTYAYLIAQFKKQNIFKDLQIDIQDINLQ